MPACFFRIVHEDTSDAIDFTIEGFVDYFTKHKESYVEKFKKGKSIDASERYCQRVCDVELDTAKATKQ